MESMEMNGGQNGGVGMNGGQNGVNGDEWGQSGGVGMNGWGTKWRYWNGWVIKVVALE